MTYAETQKISAHDYRYETDRGRYMTRERIPDSLDPIPGTMTLHEYSGDRIISDYSVVDAEAGTTVADTRYIWGPNGLVAIHDAANDTYRFVHADHLGSTRLLTDGVNGGVTNRLDFSAWGETLRATGQQIPRYGWCGAHGYQDLSLPARGSEANPPADSSYGLIHIGARYYAPDLGRWIMRDPIGMGGGGNVYVYGVNSPLSNIDPSGHVLVDVGGMSQGINKIIQRRSLAAVQMGLRVRATIYQIQAAMVVRGELILFLTGSGMQQLIFPAGSRFQVIWGASGCIIERVLR